MEPAALDLTLLPAPDDPALDTQEYQKELSDFHSLLWKKGLQGYPLRTGSGRGSEVVSSGAYLGQFLVIAAPTIGPLLGTVVGAWLHARYGRKVRLKIGDIEAEAQSEEQVEKLLQQAEEFRQRNQPKVIHEP
jgi:hypothetical protein